MECLLFFLKGVKVQSVHDLPRQVVSDAELLLESLVAAGENARPTMTQHKAPQGLLYRKVLLENNTSKNQCIIRNYYNGHMTK